MINEIFNGLQGEGKTQGQPRTFIRMNGCNLRCNFCDSSYTWGKGDSHISLPNLDDIRSSIVITGGEPTIDNNWEFISENIFSKPFDFIEVETNGTIIPDYYLGAVDLWNISPKPHYWMKKDTSVVECEPILLTKKSELRDYIVKFVIKDNRDLDFILNVCKKYLIPRHKIWLMPCTTNDKDAKSTEEVYDLANTLDVNFSARLHVLIKGNERGF